MFRLRASVAFVGRLPCSAFSWSSLRLVGRIPRTDALVLATVAVTTVRALHFLAAPCFSVRAQHAHYMDPPCSDPPVVTSAQHAHRMVARLRCFRFNIFYFF